MPIDFAAQAYKQSNKVPLLGFILLFLATIIVGPLLGGLTFFISNIVYLIIIFPIGMGIGAGLAIVTASKWGKVRNVFVSIFFAILLGTSVYAFYWAGTYLSFRNEFRAFIQEEFVARDFSNPGEAVDSEILDLVMDEFLLEATGRTGFLAFVTLVAQEGESIGRVGRGSSINLGPTMTYILWGVELLLVLGTAAFITFSEAKRPFCETHNKWYKTGTHLGGVPYSQGEALLRALRAGDFTEVHALVRQNTMAPSYELYISHCPHCTTEPHILRVDELTRNSKGAVKQKRKIQVLLDSAQDAQLLQAFATPADSLP